MNPLVAVDRDQHPVEQYRIHWIEVIQYLALLYLHTKAEYYAKAGKLSDFDRHMKRYRDMGPYATDFYHYIIDKVDASEYAMVQGKLEQIHKQIRSRTIRPRLLREVFVALRDDALTWKVQLKSVMLPLLKYFRESAEPNVEVEKNIIDGLARIRNPRIRRLLAMVSQDLESMAEGQVRPVATIAEIEAMSKIARLTLVRDTDDADTLSILLTYAQNHMDGSVIAALFAKGYTDNNAAKVYMGYKLVTPAQLAKLSDEVLSKYLLSWHNWYDWYTKYPFRDHRRWEKIYSKILVGREDLALELSLSTPPSLGTLRKWVATHVSPSKIPPAVALQVWPFAEDPITLVRKIPKKDRIDVADKYLNQLDTWLFDATRDEVGELISAGIINVALINKHFRAPSGEVLRAFVYASDEQRRQFFAQVDDKLYQWLSKYSDFGRSIKLGIGSKARLSAVWATASDPGKKLLTTFLSTHLIRSVMEDDDNEVVGEVLTGHEEDNARLFEGFKAKYGNSWRSAPRNQLKEIVAVSPPYQTVEIFKDLHLTDRGLISELLGIVARRADPDTLVDLVRMDLNVLVKSIVYSRLPPKFVFSVEGAPQVDLKWVVENYPPGKLKDLVQRYPWYITAVGIYAKKTGRVPQEEIAWFIEECNRQDKTEVRTYFVSALEDSDEYVTHSDPEVVKAALVNASPEKVRKALRTGTRPYFSVAMEREDADLHADEYLEAFLQHPFGPGQTVTSSGVGTAQDFWTDMVGDEWVMKLSESAFKSWVGRMLLSFGTDTLHGTVSANVFGPYTIYRVVASAPDLTSQVVRSPLAGFAAPLRKGYARQVTDIQSVMDMAEQIPGRVNYMVKAVRDKFIGAYVENGEWMRSAPDALLEQIKPIASWSSTGFVLKELDRRQALRVAQAADELGGLVLDLLRAGSTDQAAQALEDSLGSDNEDTVKGATDVISRLERDDLLSEVLPKSSKKVLIHVWNKSYKHQVMVVDYCSDDRKDELWNSWIGRLTNLRDLKTQPQKLNTKHRRLKVAMIRRADADQAIEFLRWLWREQKEMGSRAVQEAFLAKIDSDRKFRSMLIKFLLSKEFNLRVKQFTLDMIPLITKLDDQEVFDRFNRSHRFREHKLGGASNYFDGLETDRDKRDFLDTCDSGMLESILRSKIEEVLPLSSPLGVRLAIGTNNKGATSPLLNRINTSSKMITHLRALKLVLERSSDAEVKNWIMTNALQALDDIKRTDNTETDVRVDAIPVKEAQALEEKFLATWEGSGRNIEADVKGVYKVTHPRYDDWKPPSGDVADIRTLYHGTHYMVAGLIIQNHFKVMRSAKSGRAFGNGIYFADVGSKCAQYLSEGFGRFNSSGVIFVCSVDVGNLCDLTDPANRQYRSNWQAAGFDSIYWPARRNTSDGYGGRDAEYCVADVSRIKVDHIIHLERKRQV